jgi:hypothetical protein
MSFSYGSIPPPESPPLRATVLSPAPPARTDRRTKRHTTMDLSLAGLNLNDGLASDPLNLGAAAKRSDSSSSSSSSFSQQRAKRQSAAGAIPVPKMINPLPANYRHPSSASSGSTPSLTNSRASSISTYEFSESSAASIGSTRSSRHSLVSKPSQASFNHDSSLHTISSSDSLASNCEPITPTTATFARSRLVLFFPFPVAPYATFASSRLHMQPIASAALTSVYSPTGLLT